MWCVGNRKRGGTEEAFLLKQAKPVSPTLAIDDLI